MEIPKKIDLGFPPAGDNNKWIDLAEKINQIIKCLEEFKLEEEK